MVDGLIIFNTRYTTSHFVKDYIKILEELKFNFVILHYFWGKANVNYIGLDYENDAYKAISYLVSLGHENIAVIAGPSRAAVTSKIKRGCKRALGDHKISTNNYTIAYADYDYQTAYEWTRTIIKKNPLITSFFVGGYEMAPACLKAVKDSGLEIPKDISIICYVDSEMMPLLDPPLTAIKLPYYEMGKKAAEIILRGNAERKRFIFETELVIRGSTRMIRDR